MEWDQEWASLRRPGGTAPDNTKVNGSPARTPPTIVNGKPQHNINGLHRYWLRHAQPAPRTLREAERAVEMFKKVNGNMLLVDIERRHIVAVRDHMIGGSAPATIKKILSLLRAMFSTALQDDKIKANPVAGVVVRGERGRTKVRRPWSVEQINAMLALPVYTQGSVPEVEQARLRTGSHYSGCTPGHASRSWAA